MFFHVCEESGIREFEPRTSEYTIEPVVWAIDASRLRSYLLPRDCPRVTVTGGSSDRDSRRCRRRSP